MRAFEHVHAAPSNFSMGGRASSSIEFRFLRHLALWTFICGAGAAPSFVLAYMAFNKPSQVAAMLTGIAIFIAGYTLVSMHPWTERFKRRPFVRRTLYIGYGARIVMSVFYPVGIFVDLWCGVAAVSITRLDGGDNESFAVVLITTLVQGIVLNILLMVFMSLVYSVQWLFMKPPPILEHGCKNCGYDMRATPERCPECGASNGVVAAALAH